MNRRGNGLLVWIHAVGSTMTTVRYRTIAPGGVLGGFHNLTSPQVGSFNSPAAAINDSGEAVVAWRIGNSIQAVSRTSLTGTFQPQPAATLDAANANGAPSVAIDNAGAVIAVWPSAINGRLDYARGEAGDSWPTSGSVKPPGHTLSNQSLAANPVGQMVMAFADTTGGTHTVISEVDGTVSGGFSSTVNPLSGNVLSNLHGPVATIDDSGGAVVGWTDGSAVNFSRKQAGGSFPGPTGVQSISPVPVSPASFTLAGDGRGDVIASWYGFETSVMHNVVRAAVKPARANTFGTSRVVSSTTSDYTDPVVALDQNGDGVVGLQRGNSGMPLGVAAAIYDASGPRLSTPTGPRSLKFKTKASFSVSATDAFSGISGVSWNFGDGSAKASGTHVSHVFVAPGRYTVRVTATDHAGNSSSVAFSVTVTGPHNRCVVPRLKGKTLAQAKRALKRSHCKLGKVTKPKRHKHHKLRKLVVKRSKPSAGSVRPVGTKIALTLVQVPKKKHK